MRFTKEQIILLLSPCVYVFWRENQCLYVGMSSRGITRPLSSSHHINRNFDYSYLEIRNCSSTEQAYKEEKKLIKELKPLINEISSVERDKVVKISNSIKEAAKLTEVDPKRLKRTLDVMKEAKLW